MPTYTFKESYLPKGTTCVELETMLGLKRGEVVSMTSVEGNVIVETLVPTTISTIEPPIIAIMDSVLKARGLAGLTGEERAKAVIALK